jgi:hypothetical protein
MGPTASGKEIIHSKYDLQQYAWVSSQESATSREIVLIPVDLRNFSILLRCQNSEDYEKWKQILSSKCLCYGEIRPSDIAEPANDLKIDHDTTPAVKNEPTIDATPKSDMSVSDQSLAAYLASPIAMLLSLFVFPLHSSKGEEVRDILPSISSIIFIFRCCVVYLEWSKGRCARR